MIPSRDAAVSSEGWMSLLRSTLAARPEGKIPDVDCGLRAAVTMILRSGESPEREPQALFVRRARVERDPWSGHVALPGGRWDPSDADLVETARRETLEETGLHLERGDFIGRLREIHPRSAHLPSICVTPFVARLQGDQVLTLNHELTGHLWIPVSALSDPAYRSTLVRDLPARREFPSIDYRGDVVWGLTFEIIRDFLAALDSATGRTRGGGDGAAGA